MEPASLKALIDFKAQHPEYKVGDYYRDLVNGDLLRILAFSDDAIYDDQPDVLVRFAKLAVFIGGKVYLGVQEMKLIHLSKAERFEKITGLRLLWLRVKHRNKAKSMPAAGGDPWKGVNVKPPEKKEQ